MPGQKAGKSRPERVMADIFKDPLETLAVIVEVVQDPETSAKLKELAALNREWRAHIQAVVPDIESIESAKAGAEQALAQAQATRSQASQEAAAALAKAEGNADDVIAAAKRRAEEILGAAKDEISVAKAALEAEQQAFYATRDETTAALDERTAALNEVAASQDAKQAELDEALTASAKLKDDLERRAAQVRAALEDA